MSEAGSLEGAGLVREGSYSDRGSANQEVYRLRAQGYKAEVIPSAEGSFYIQYDPKPHPKEAPLDFI